MCCFFDANKDGPSFVLLIFDVNDLDFTNLHSSPLFNLPGVAALYLEQRFWQEHGPTAHTSYHGRPGSNAKRKKDGRSKCSYHSTLPLFLSG